MRVTSFDEYWSRECPPGSLDSLSREIALKAWNAALRSASELLDIDEQEIRLSAGEMTRGEMRTTKAVLGGRVALIRDLEVQDMKLPKILPVIHYLDRETAFSEVGTAVSCGADGVFLISHHGNDQELVDVGVAIMKKHPGFPIGINLLSTNALDAATFATGAAFPMLWGDDLGVDSLGLDETGKEIESLRCSNPGFEIFASVAFKYRPYEPDPANAARNALKAGFIPTTSGSGTGSAPELDKIVAMSQATGGVLAIASGMTPWNVAEYAPFVSHILVATGIAVDEHRMDADKLKLLSANARSAKKL